MGLSPATLRSTILTGLATVLDAESPAWELSLMPVDVFPGKDTRQIASLSYAVGLGATEPNDPDRQSLSAGALVRTTVIVKFASLLRDDNNSTDYGTALTREALLVKTLSAIKGTAQNRPLIVSIDRETTEDGLLFVGTITATVLHRYPLS